MKYLNQATKPDVATIIYKYASNIFPTKAEFILYFCNQREKWTHSVGDLNFSRYKEWMNGVRDYTELSISPEMAKEIISDLYESMDTPRELAFSKFLNALKDCQFDIRRFQNNLLTTHTTSYYDETIRKIMDVIVDAAFTRVNSTEPACKEHSCESKYGVYICARHEDWALAGRVRDYLDGHGYQPFLDEVSLYQDESVNLNLIRNTPFFICLLTSSPAENDRIYQGVKVALESKREVFLFIERGFSIPVLHPEIDAIRKCTCFEIGRTNFSVIMQDFCKKLEENKETLLSFLDWRQMAHTRKNTYIASRKTIQHEIATHENTFGPSFIRSVREKKEFTGEIQVKRIRMACFSANIIFAHNNTMIDEKAFDRGVMFNIFAQLLQDPSFSLEVVITAPDSIAAHDAIHARKLGNSALEAYPEAVFLGAFYNIRKLIENDPVFKKAYQETRFRYLVTDNVLPYALFQVEYKPGMEQNNYIKVDLYSEGVVSNMDRRSFLVFESDDLENNYRFFEERYNTIRDVQKSRKLIRENLDKWIKDWEDLQKEMVE